MRIAFGASRLINPKAPERPRIDMTDTTMPKTVRVTRDQVSAARALIRLRGGVDNVDPVIAKVASARPRTPAEHTKAS